MASDYSTDDICIYVTVCCISHYLHMPNIQLFIYFNVYMYFSQAVKRC